MNDWHTAACREEDPELFFPLGTDGPAAIQAEQAKAVCRRCPVIEQCLQFALAENISDGVFGGLAASERASLRRAATRNNLTQEQTAERAGNARTHVKATSLEQLFQLNTVRLFGGHLAWTGKAQVWFEGRPYNPKKLAFIVDRGRDPEGRVLGDCGNNECVLPAHVADDAERMRCGTRAGYLRHQRNGEKPCDACRQANTDADNRLRRTGTSKAAA